MPRAGDHASLVRGLVDGGVTFHDGQLEIRTLNYSKTAALAAALAFTAFAQDSHAQMFKNTGMFQGRYAQPSVIYYPSGYVADAATYVQPAPVAPAATIVPVSYVVPAAPAVEATAPAAPASYSAGSVPAATTAESKPASTPPAAKDGGHKESWVWLDNEGMWGYGYQVPSGKEKGQWKIRLTSKPTETREPEQTVQAIGDPYGFVSILNGIRAQNGLPPVAYDENLSAWAAQNNASQSQFGLGHFVNPGSYQNSGWNYPDAASVAAGWMASPGHRMAMLALVSRVGIAYGPGPYWTMNAQ